MHQVGVLAKGVIRLGEACLFVWDVVSVVQISAQLMSLFVTVHTNTPILCFYNYLLVMG